MDGLVAVGGELSSDSLNAAYRRGIFPWYSADRGEPVLWWSPDPRTVLWVSNFKLSKSLSKTIRLWRAKDYSVRIDFDRAAVIKACAEMRHPRQASIEKNDEKDETSVAGTWISQDIQSAYLAWQIDDKDEAQQSYAMHSVGVYNDNHLIGGFYGVGIGRMFFGESMFARETDASKVALACFILWAQAVGIDLIDCQQATRHLISLGATKISRKQFEAAIQARIALPAIDWVAAAKLDLLRFNTETK